MPRHIKFSLVFLAILCIAGVTYYFDLQQRIRDLVRQQPEPAQPYLAENPVFPATAPTRKIKLFFASPTKEGLLEMEERDIHSSEQVTTEAKQIVAELIQGSKEGRGRVIPPETKLREVFLTEEGLLYVDLTGEVSVNHPGGLTQEVSTIYAIVNSLTENIPSIQRVQILVEGNEAETLAGHVDISQALEHDLSMTSLAQTESRQN